MGTPRKTETTTCKVTGCYIETRSHYGLCKVHFKAAWDRLYWFNKKFKTDLTIPFKQLDK